MEDYCAAAKHHEEQPVTLVLEEYFAQVPPKEELESFSEILRTYNRDQVGTSTFRKLVLLLKDQSGTVKGGLEGHTYFGWLFVEIAKLITGIKVKTGDRFVEPLLLGIGLGRIGCFLSGKYDQTFWK